MLCKQWHCPPGVLDTSSHLSFSLFIIVVCDFLHGRVGQPWDLCEFKDNFCGSLSSLVGSRNEAQVVWLSWQSFYLLSQLTSPPLLFISIRPAAPFLRLTWWCCWEWRPGHQGFCGPSCPQSLTEMLFFTDFCFRIEQGYHVAEADLKFSM